MNEELKVSKLHPHLATTKEGRVKNLKTGKYRKISVNTKGYCYIGTKQGTYYVHRLVALAWIPNPHDKPEVNHINGDKSDNRVVNLEWVTREENMQHAAKNNLLVINCNHGEECNLSKFKDEDIVAICELLSENMRVIDVVRLTGYPKDLVKGVKSGKRWKHISKDYTFYNKQNMYSKETVLWVRKKISEGFGNTEILKMSNNPKLTLHAIKNIKYKNAYPHYK